MRATAGIVALLVVLGGCASPTQDVAMGAAEASSAIRDVERTVEQVDAGLPRRVARVTVDDDLTALVQAQSRVEQASVVTASDGETQDQVASAVAEALAATRAVRRLLDHGSADELMKLTDRVDRSVAALDVAVEVAGPPR